MKTFVIIFISVFFSSLITFFLYRSSIFSKYLIDKNSSGFGSKSSTITGSGIVFLLILNIFFFIFLYLDFLNFVPNKFWVMFLSINILGAISFYDDFRSTDPRLRLIIQVIVVFFSTSLLNFEQLNFPFKIVIFCTIFLWIYIINITNFIDGCDGFLAVNAFFFFLNIFLINFLLGAEIFSNYLALVIMPLLSAFFLFNYPPARLFMGDTGSIVLGYLVGFSILELVTKNYYSLAILLYAYPIIDCSLTLFKKILKGHSPWDRLFDYFFLIPIKKNQRNNKLVLLSTTIYNVLNSMFILLYITTNHSIIFIAVFILVILKLYIFKYKIN